MPTINVTLKRKTRVTDDPKSATATAVPGSVAKADAAGLDPFLTSKGAPGFAAFTKVSVPRADGKVIYHAQVVTGAWPAKTVKDYELVLG